MGPVERVWGALPGRWKVRLLRATQGTFLIGVIGLVRDPAGRILVLEHRFRRHALGFPGGYMTTGEAPHEALARELKEETGLAAQVAPEILEAWFEVPAGRMTVALAATSPGGPLALSNEIVSGGFVGLDALPDTLDPDHRRLVQRWARYPIAESPHPE